MAALVGLSACQRRSVPIGPADAPPAPPPVAAPARDAEPVPPQAQPRTRVEAESLSAPPGAKVSTQRPLPPPPASLPPTPPPPAPPPAAAAQRPSVPPASTTRPAPVSAPAPAKPLSTAEARVFLASAIRGRGYSCASLDTFRETGRNAWVATCKGNLSYRVTKDSQGRALVERR